MVNSIINAIAAIVMTILVGRQLPKKVYRKK